MRLYLSPHSGLPIYAQIVEQVKHVIVSGQLSPEDELPTIRALAQQLVVNPNTVLRAYQELEHLGLVVRRQGSGTYVSGVGSPMGVDARRKVMADKVDALLYDAQHMKLSHDALLALLEERRAALGMDENLRGQDARDAGGTTP